MVALFLTTTISCSQAMGIIYRLTKVVGLTETQKSEIIREVRNAIPLCPIEIKKDGE